MKRMQNYPLLGIALVIGLIFIVMPLTLDLCCRRAGTLLGLQRYSEPGAGHLFWPRRLLYGHVSQAGSFLASGNKNANHPGHPGFYGLESANRFALVLAAIPFF